MGIIYDNKGGQIDVGPDGKAKVDPKAVGKQVDNQVPIRDKTSTQQPVDPTTGGLLDLTPASTPDTVMPDMPTEAGTIAGNPDVGNAQRGTATIRDVADGVATTREVQDNELVSNQLSKLLNSDSKYIQDARRQGLEQANAMGGLGGTLGVGAAQTSALRAALPIAQNDAASYVQAASENLAALNQMAQVNVQKATELEKTRIGAQASLDTTTISSNAQLAATRLQTAAQRDISKLDNDTKVLITNMDGVIRKALAEDQFHYSQILQDAQYAAELANTQMQGEYGLAGTALGKQWDMEIQKTVNAQNERSNYTTQATSIFSDAMTAFGNLNGVEMDENARKSAAASIWGFAKIQMDVLNAANPDQPPLVFQWPAGV
jgi:hypothetical protein